MKVEGSGGVGMLDIIESRITENLSVIKSIKTDLNIQCMISLISKDIVNTIKNENKLIIAGNGGSFADSFHFAGEFVSKFNFDREPLPAIALGGNNSILTAVSNDYSYDNVFSREIKAIGNKGDVFIAISTSGNSTNIINAINEARNKGIKVYGLTGKNGGQMKKLCDCVHIPSDVTPRIQEAHELIFHIICELVENEIFKNRNGKNLT